MNWRLRSLIGCWFLIASAHIVSAQVDTEFWFVAPEVASSHGDRPVLLRISTLNQAATVTIEMPADSSFPSQTINIAANSLSSVNLTSFAELIENKPADQVLNKGLHITSSAPVTAYYEVNTSCNCNPDIFPLKGQNALGTSFWIVAQNFWRNALGTSSFDIVATEDGTQVTITPSAAITGHAAGQTFTINLDRGETYSAAAAGTEPEAHLMGSRVTSNKKIAITLKDDSMQSSSYGGCADLMGDQMVPENLAGKEFIVMKGYLGTTSAPREDKIFITATRDNTTVTVAGTTVTTLAAGGTFAQNINESFTYITTSEPVHILQVTGFGCEVGGSVLPAIDCTGSEQVSFVRSTNEFFGINIMVEAADVGNFTLDGNPLSSNAFTVVPNTNGKWMSVRRESLEISVGRSILVSNSSGRFHLGVINGNAATGCRYGYFSSYSKISVDITANAPICPGNDLVLEAEQLANGAYTWQGPNGFSSTQRVVTIPNITSNQAGTYGVQVSAEGCESALTEVEVTLINNPDPIVNIATNDQDICLGDNALFEAEVINPAPVGETTYEWRLNGVVVANGRQYTNNNLSDGDQLQVTAAFADPDANCYSFSEMSSEPITISVSTPDVATVAIETANPEVCKGELVSFTSAVVNAGTPTYEWLVNGVVVGTNSAILETTNLANGDIVQLRVLVGSPCAVTPTITSNQITMTVRETVVSIVANNSPLCPGETLQLEASVIEGATYQWEGPNGYSAQGRIIAVENIALNQAGGYSVVANANGCASEPSPIEVNVLDQPTPEVIIETSNQQICIGEDASFTATVTNAPTSGMTYQWTVNGVSVGSNSPNYTTQALTSGDQIQVTLAFSGDNTRCYPFTTLTSDPVTIAVNDPGPATVEIRASSPTICQDDTILFTSILINAGTPTYQWKVNGQNAGANQASFETNALSDGDEVSLTVEVGLTCTPTPNITSDPIIITVQNNPEIPLPSQVIFCSEEGEFALLEATTDGVTNYEWFPNGENTASITTDVEGVYEVKASLPTGCNSKASVEVFDRCPMEVYVPNAFTPNGDGINDGFRIFGKNIASIDFKVYNRWGELIYQSNNFEDVWDGKYLGELVQAGNYFWRLTCTPIDTTQLIQEFKGELNIFRQ